MRYIVWIWGAIAVVVALALMFGPRRPDAPPASDVRYEDVPRAARAALHLGDIASPGVVEATQEPPVDETLSRNSFIVHGTVTSASSGKPIIRARVFCTMDWTEEETQANQARLDEARASGDPDQYTAVLDELQTRFDAYTDSRGRYAMDVGRAGTYTVKGSQVGFVEATDTAVLAEGQPRAKVDLALPDGASIRGTVTEADSGKPAPGVAVTCEGGASGTVKTDENGEYILKGLLPGEYKVTLDLRDSPFQVRGRAPSQVATIEAPDQQVRDIDFVVNAAGIVWGYVYGPDKMAVERAAVALCTGDSIVSQIIDTVTKQAPPIMGNSEKDGYYELIGVPLGEEWHVFGLAKELAPQLSEAFILTEKNRNVRVDLYMFPGTTVYGQIINSVDNSPVPGAQIACIPAYAKFFSPMDSPQAVRDTTSDSQGLFTIPDLPIGEYQILAQHDGYKFMTMGERISPDGIQDIDGLKVALTPVNTGEYSVYGYVMDGNGNAISGAKLELAGFGLAQVSVDAQQRETDSAGYFLFEGVDPGMMVLQVGADGYAPQTVNNVLLDQENLVYLEATATVAGRVLVRETGQPLESFSLRAMPLTVSGSSGLFRMAESMDSRNFSDPDGAFSMGLAAGSYRLEASAPELTAGRTNVEVEPGQQQTNVVIYVSQSGGTIQGHVRLADGTNPQGAVVYLSDASSQLHNVFAFADQMNGGGYAVNSDGLFEFTGLPEGAYGVTARLSGFATAQQGPIDLREGRTAGSIQLVLGAGGTLQGYVYKDGAVETGAVVSIVGNGVSQMATTDRNGFYILEHLPAGTYMASKISMGSGNPLAALTPMHARVEVFEGQVTLYNFGEDTSSGGTIHGYTNVTMNLGSVGFAILSLPGSEEQLSNLNFTNPLEWFDSNSTLASAIMDIRPMSNDGGFTMENVPEGSYVLSIFTASPGQLLTGGADVVYQDIVDVQGTEPIELNIDVE